MRRFRKFCSLQINYPFIFFLSVRSFDRSLLHFTLTHRMVWYRIQINIYILPSFTDFSLSRISVNANLYFLNRVEAIIIVCSTTTTTANKQKADDFLFRLYLNMYIWMFDAYTQCTRRAQWIMNITTIYLGNEKNGWFVVFYVDFMVANHTHHLAAVLRMAPVIFFCFHFHFHLRFASNSIAIIFFGNTNYLTLFMTAKAQAPCIHEFNLYGIMTFVTPYLILSNGCV